MAKCLNLLMYVMLVSLPLNLCPALMGLKTRGSTGLFPLGHFAGVLLMAAAVSSIIVICCGALMRHVRKERLQSVITYSQVALTMVFAMGYQVIPRIVGGTANPAGWNGPEWLSFFPPAWFASASLVVQGKATIESLQL